VFVNRLRRIKSHSWINAKVAADNAMIDLSGNWKISEAPERAKRIALAAAIFLA
jgi:hypothetical protein